MVSLATVFGLYQHGRGSLPIPGSVCRCSQEEAQPMYTNYPFGVCLAHNGNLTNVAHLRESVFAEARHINTDSVRRAPGLLAFDGSP